MAMQGTLPRDRKKSVVTASRVPAIVCIAAITLICFYSAFTVTALRRQEWSGPQDLNRASGPDVLGG